jgi:hypothetical protein
VVNARGRFSLSPASRETVGQLGQMLQAATEVEASSATSDHAGSSSTGISPRLWQELKPGTLMLAAGFDDDDNPAGWWDTIIVKVDDGEFLVRWRDYPPMSRGSVAAENISLCCIPDSPSSELNKRKGRLSAALSFGAGNSGMPYTALQRPTDGLDGTSPCQPTDQI